MVFEQELHIQLTPLAASAESGLLPLSTWVLCADSHMAVNTEVAFCCAVHASGLAAS